MNGQNTSDHICLIAVKSGACPHVQFNLPLGIMFVNCISLYQVKKKAAQAKRDQVFSSFPLFPQEAKVTSRGT